jgi:hypothetical protein
LPESTAEEKRVDDAFRKNKLVSHEATIFTDDPVHCFFHAFLDAWACTDFPIKHLDIFALRQDAKKWLRNNSKILHLKGIIDDWLREYPAIDQLSRENHLFQLRDNRLPTSVPAHNTHCLIVNTTKLVLSLLPLFPQGSNERETLRQFVHFLPQLLYAAGLRHQHFESSSALIAQGKWRQVWRMALARAANLQAKREKNPSTARQRFATEKAKYAHKCATAGNVSKACKIVCQEMIPACSDDTVEKLRDLHPERSLNLNLENLPTPEFSSQSTSSFSLMSRGNFSLFFCPNLRGAFVCVSQERWRYSPSSVWVNLAPMRS